MICVNTCASSDSLSPKGVGCSTLSLAYIWLLSGQVQVEHFTTCLVSVPGVYRGLILPEFRSYLPSVLPSRLIVTQLFVSILVPSFVGITGLRGNKTVRINACCHVVNENVHFVPELGGEACLRRARSVFLFSK